MPRNCGAYIRMQAQYAGNRRFGMHVQLFSHMHGVEASGAVGLFIRTKVIIPNFICHNCTYTHANSMIISFLYSRGYTSTFCNRPSPTTLLHALTDWANWFSLFSKILMWDMVWTTTYTQGQHNERNIKQNNKN